MFKLMQFNITLVALAPVHIGSGKTYTQKEYIYEKEQYYFPDMGWLYQAVIEKGDWAVTEFEDYLLGNKKYFDPRSRLIDVLNKLHIDRRDFGGYKIKENGYELSKDTKRKGGINEIDAFIKNAYGKPYIPGSSLKGALRTILVNEEFMTENTRRNNQAIPWGGSDDIFHNIRVADSAPLDINQLQLVQKWDYSSKKTTLNPIPLYRESISPMTRIDFRVTCEGEEAAHLIENLQNYAHRHYQHYRQRFLDQLPSEYILQPNLKGMDSYLYIGGGTGFWTKTLIDQAIKPKGSPKMRMVGDGVHKLTKAPINAKFNANYKLLKNNQNLYEMGKCYFIVSKEGN